MSLEMQFLLFAERLTGTLKQNISIINVFQDDDGYLSGVIEIDGCREFIHEYI